MSRITGEAYSIGAGLVVRANKKLKSYVMKATGLEPGKEYQVQYTCLEPSGKVEGNPLYGISSCFGVEVSDRKSVV